MAQLIVRNIEESVVRKLKRKAAQDGVSMEEEHRRILRSSLLGKAKPPKMSFKEFLLTMPEGLTDEYLARPKSFPREIDLS